MRRVSTAFVLASLMLAAYVPGAAAAGRTTVVVFIGGLGSTPATTLEDFRLLHGGLFTSAGYRPGDVRYFDYASCGSLADSEAALAAMLRGLRDGGEASGVVLVGHSNGGVIALDVPAVAPDLAPFIRRIVTVDSPLYRLAALDTLACDVFNIANGPCPAAHDLNERAYAPGLSDYLGQLTAWEQAQGIGVYAVANVEDQAVPLLRQQLPASVNYVLDVADSGLNHAAVLKTPIGVAQLVTLVGRQGQ